MQSAPANLNDHCQILTTVKFFPLLGDIPGSPRKHPQLLLADAEYDSDGTRAILCPGCQTSDTPTQSITR